MRAYQSTMASESYQDVLHAIELRRSRLESLEQRAACGSMADVIETLLAQTVGTVRFTLQPYDYQAYQVFEQLYRSELMRKLDKAFWFYFATGVGGIALTPLGIRVIDPKRFAWEGEIEDPPCTYRVFEVPREQLRTMARSLRVHEVEEAALWEQLEGERLQILEEYDHDTHTWRYHSLSGQRVLFEFPAKWYEGHYLLLGRYRPRQRGRRGNAMEGFPIGVTEHSRQHADYYDDLYEATVRDTMQGTLLQVYLPGVDDEARERLLWNFKVIPLRQPQPAAFPLKQIDLGTISAVRQQVNYELGMSSGAIGYARGIPMNVEYATEAALIGQNAQIRVNRWQDYHHQFIERVLEAARAHWADLPLEQHRHWFKVGTAWYGVRDRYGDALHDKQVIVPLVAQDFVEQRQKTILLMSILSKVLPAMAGTLDPRPLMVGLLRELLWTHGINPDDYLFIPLGGEAYQNAGEQNGLGIDLSTLGGIGSTGEFGA
jgi:hypothetical protein